jgi:hypothetical protein
MSDKKIIDFVTLTDGQAADDTRLVGIGTASTGTMGKATIAQMKNAFATKSTVYVATGTEGSTLTITALANRSIVAVFRGPGPIYPVTSSPASDEYTWDNTNIGLGAAVGGAGEKFLILHKSY